MELVDVVDLDVLSPRFDVVENSKSEPTATELLSDFHRVLLEFSCISDKTLCNDLDFVGLDNVGSGDRGEGKAEVEDEGEGAGGFS
jgi:hypothetical protein